MSKLKALLAVFLMTTMLSGCGAIMSMRAGSTQFDMITQPNGENIESEPVKSKIFEQVRTVVIADYSDYIGSDIPKDNVRVYKLLVKQLELKLKKTGKYKVVSAKEFRKEIKKQEQEFDLMVDSIEDRYQSMAKVGRGLGVHGVIELGIEEDGNVTSIGNQFKMMKNLMIDGEIRVPMEVRLTMIRSKNADQLYTQANKVLWVSGSMGLNNSKTAEITTVINKNITPLIKGLTTV